MIAPSGTLELEPIRPVSDLQKRFSEIEALAASSPVRLTKNGKNAYVLFTEDGFRRAIEDIVDEARFEAELAYSVERGVADIESGRSHSLADALDLMDRARKQAHA